jgi:hypothetical protein
MRVAECIAERTGCCGSLDRKVIIVRKCFEIAKPGDRRSKSDDVTFGGYNARLCVASVQRKPNSNVTVSSFGSL